MSNFPLTTPSTALFLDFDGTLVAFAETPDAVEVPSLIVALLGDLHVMLEGALAIVSGRQIDVLDRFLAPLRLPLAGEHGMQRRDAAGNRWEQQCPDLDLVLEACNGLAKDHPSLLVERKHAAVALHYRRAPGLEVLCRETLRTVLEGKPQFEMLHGKFVVEVIPAGVNKGNAITAFMREHPFSCRVPVFVGDDTTDESGFCAVQSRGGSAIKVGPGPTLARHRLDSPQAVYEWLVATRDLLAATRKKACP